MKLAMAYISVIAIWSCTPLAIVFSNRSFSFWAAGALRMMIGLAILLAIVALRPQRLFPSKQVLYSYLIGAAGFLPNTLLVYWAAQFVPSGVISVIFALTPFIVGVQSWVILKDGHFTWRRHLSMLVAAIGMAVIYIDQLHVDKEAAVGVIALIAAVVVWGGSTVGLKRLDVKVDPLCQTTGSLLFAAPGLLFCWWLFDGTLPQVIETQSLLAVLFLAVIGSVLGFSLYYFVLSNISAVSASLITLIVPVLAIILGVSFGGEALSARLLVGVFIVLFSLLFYLDIGYRLLALRLKQKMLRVFAVGFDSGPRPGTR